MRYFEDALYDLRVCVRGGKKEKKTFSESYSHEKEKLCKERKVQAEKKENEDKNWRERDHARAVFAGMSSP